MPTTSQRSFSSGEIAPELHSRVDLQKYFSALRTCRNSIVSRAGGVFNRPGTEYIGKTKYNNEFKVRLIEFSFNEDQTYVIEFGHYYARVIQNGDYIRKVGVTGNPPIEIETPYRHEYLADLNYAQSGDVITITHQYYPPQDLKRTDDGWVIEETRTRSNVEAPASVNTRSDDLPLNPRNSGAYAVTTVNENGEESFPTLWTRKTPSSSQRSINNNAQTPVIVEWSAVDEAEFYNVYKRIAGNHELLSVVDARVGAANNTSLSDIGQDTDPTVTPPIDEPVFKAKSLTINWVKITENGDNNIAVMASKSALADFFGSSNVGAEATIVAVNVGTLTLRDGSVIRWAYEAVPFRVSISEILDGDGALLALLGPVSGFEKERNSLERVSIDFLDGFFSPSNGVLYKIGDFPRSVGYYQQRRFYASTINEPGRVFASKIGRYNDFTRKRVISDDDPFNFTIASRDVSPIKQMLGLSDMIFFSGTGEFSLGDTVTPSTLNVRQQSYHGINDGVRPIVVGRSAFFVQARSSIVRDYLYNFQANGYEGNDLTVFSSHLFDGYDLRDWAFQQSPQSNLWVIRSDGGINCLTFIREQAIIAWSRHDLEGGKAISSISIDEGRSDVVYMIVERDSEYFVERLKSQTIRENRDFNFVDSSVTFDGRNTNGTRLRLEPFNIRNKKYLIKIDGFNNTMTDRVTLGIGEGNENQDYRIRLRHGGFTLTFSGLLRAGNIEEIFCTLDSDDDISSLQGEDIYDWEFQTHLLPDIPHLEGKDLSVFADGIVLHSPNNPSYPKRKGAPAALIQNRLLDRFYTHIRVGLPITADIETLDVDSLQTPGLKKNKKMITSVVLDLINTRGLFVGPKKPAGNTIEGLVELKIRESEGYNDPVRLYNGAKEVNIRAEWNSNGRVFIRQVDPLPFNIAAISPSGYMPTS